jgi:hypothetical protein
MMTLKYPVPCVCSNDGLDNTVFTLPPQGEPGMSVVTQANLQRLSEHIRQRLSIPVTVTCHPHRVGLSSCVAVTVVGRLRRVVNILITVSGQGSWPAEEDYEYPRWYITVTDAADMAYLVLWLGCVLT